MKRNDGRTPYEHRPLRIQRGFTRYSAGSVFIELGETRVLVTASVENRVPPFLRDSKTGWITAEYAMLPSATHTRSHREGLKGKPSGRSSEIQRLIGRSLRASVDMSILGERSIIIDADVIQADGGTRTAAITGGMIALTDAVNWMIEQGWINQSPIRKRIAAISAGIVGGIPMVDLCYEEDSVAEVDMNIVMTESGQIVEIQGTGEQNTFSKEQLSDLVALSESAIQSIMSQIKP